MILPTKKLRPENSLIYLGGTILALLDEPKTVSRVWEDFQKRRMHDLRRQSCDISFDWFVLALDALYSIGALNLEKGKLAKAS